MPEIHIRLASSEDAPALLAVYSPYVTKTAVSFETEVPTEDEFRQRILHTMENYPYLVAEADSRVVGYAYASPFRSRKAYSHMAEMSIYILDEYHGLGIGKAFYQEMEKRLARQNIYTLYACATYTEREQDEHLTDGSIRFHQKIGFTLTARFPNCGCKFGKWYGVVWMEKPLGVRCDNPPPFMPWKHEPI